MESTLGYLNLARQLLAECGGHKGELHGDYLWLVLQEVPDALKFVMGPIPTPAPSVGPPAQPWVLPTPPPPLARAILAGLSLGASPCR